jgi:pyrimidine operon attenuation protein/uracil phosphoribosyltransferase
MQALADAERVAELIGAAADWARGLPAGDDAAGGLAIVGVRARGDVLAARLAERLNVDDVGTLDITLYRDDLSEVAAQPVVQTTDIGFGLDGRDVLLLDDVLMSGRSVRAALSVLMDYGRPRRVWLAVLVDRGPAWRELPIAADFVGLTHEGPERVSVRLTPTDAEDGIWLEDAG